MSKIKSNKPYVLVAIILITTILYLIKIASLQLFENSYQLSADNNAIRRVIDYPARGLIFDRNKKLLVYNKPIYELMAHPNRLSAFDTIELCDILEIPKDLLTENLKKARQYSKHKTSKIYGPINQDKYLILSEKMYKFKGFHIQTRFERIYPLNIAAHVLGYIGEVTKKTVDTNNYYSSGDIIGTSGIESSYEKHLRGSKGVHYLLVDANNAIVEKYKKGKFDTLGIVGNDLITTIDANLQAYAEKLMQKKRGAIVAIEPKTGEILTMVSAPYFDPNLLTSTKISKNFGKLLLDNDHPLFNRATGSETSPPGSTFKILNALIGLNEKIITTETSISCHGGFNTGSHIVGCHHNSAIDFENSIALSCNTYYCEVFSRIIRNKKYDSPKEAYDNWGKQLSKFGIGRKLNIDIPEERTGVLYTSEEYDKKFKRKNWGAFRIISLAIGQGELGITPLQLANVTATVANKGYFYTPHLVKKIVGEKNINKSFLTKNYVGIDTSYFSAVINGMEKVVLYGTASRIRLPNITQCGKTGTAQNPHGNYNSVFIAFAPKNNPKIAIAVYVENGGAGSVSAAPIASLIIEKYLTDTTSRPELEKYMTDKNLLDRGKRTDR